MAAAVLLEIFLLGGKAYTSQDQKTDQYQKASQDQKTDQKQKTNQDQKDDNYSQSLPDQSFAVIEKKPSGVSVRLLPHHDAEGKVIVPWLEESMSQIFQLDPNHRAQAREHLLKDYYEKE